MLRTWRDRALPQPAHLTRNSVSEVSNASEPLQHESSVMPIASERNMSCITPKQWYALQAKPCTIIAYVDRVSCQLLELVRLNEKHLGDFLNIPMYSQCTGEWQLLGQSRLRRIDFKQAKLFAEQEDALNELEQLLSTRWFASGELAALDAEILKAYVVAFYELGGDEVQPAARKTAPPDEADIAHLQGLLSARKHATCEMARINGELIPALQHLGVALPEDLIGSKPAPKTAQ
jgi:hypothetical protein